MEELPKRDYSTMPVEQIVTELAAARESLLSLEKLKEMCLGDIQEMEARITQLSQPRYLDVQ